MNQPPANLARQVFADPVHILAFGFGTGLSPVAPGTVGSLLGVVLAWITLDLGPIVQIGLATAMFVAGIWICGESSRRLGVHDHGGIVWDEIVAMFAVLIVVPYALYPWILAFGLFRAFDIVKPWPIRDLDHRMKGGAGIMLDDLVAALYAALLLAFWGWLIEIL
jgi:phosphatidylglycerophosphatase A